MSGSNKMGAPAHFEISVRKYLYEVFAGRWIGRGSATWPAPLDWPPQNSDVIICDNSLWGFIKEKVAQQHYTNTDEVKQAVTDAFNEITSQMLRRMSDRTWRRISIRYDNDREQTDLIDR